MFKQARYLLLTMKSLASNLADEEGGPATGIILVGRAGSSLLPRLIERLRSPHIAPEKQILAKD